MLKSYEAPGRVVARRDRRAFEKESMADRIPIVGSLAAAFRKLAQWRVGRAPVGLIALLPVALFLDLFDVADEFAGGPLGMGASFVLESAFLLAVTGKPTYALGFAGIDLLPVIDVIPFATITLVREIVHAWNEEPASPVRPNGPVIDV